MNELTTVAKRLFDSDSLGASNFKMFPGSSRDVTAEQFAAQINRVLSQIQAKDFDVVEIANEG
jgi:hypothetical protein